MQTVKKGSRGQDVAALQTVLNNLGYNAGRIDGFFGPGTEGAVKKLQAAHGLTVDGIVGPKTWAVLLGAQVQPNAGPEPVYYSQVDARWRHIMFSSRGDPKQTIGSSGCGPTSMAMILATWVNRSITPVDACKLAIDGGFRTTNDGTAWAYFPWMATKFGLRHQYGNTDQAVSALKKGALVVASMGPGYFTRGGHYVLLWGIDGQQILAHDPANKSRDRAGFDVFRREAAQYFIFTK